MLRKRLLVCLLLVLFCAPQFAFGWGDEGHMAINRAAAKKLPSSMPVFFRTATARLVYLGPEPDRWRNKAELALKLSQEPDHFIDLERTEGIGALPRGRFDYIRLLHEKRAKMGKDADLYLPEKVGFQPYIAAEIYGRLKVAFREYRRLKAAGLPTAPAEQNAVFYAGWLGHYVGDAANPLHTTIHFNGWVGENPNGYTRDKIHWPVEGPFVANNLNRLAFAQLVQTPTVLQDPWADYLSFIQTSFGQVEKLYQLEKAGAFREGGTPEGVDFVRGRLAAGAQMLANMWYTAWVESEKPVQNPY